MDRSQAQQRQISVKFWRIISGNLRDEIVISTKAGYTMWAGTTIGGLVNIIVELRSKLDAHECRLCRCFLFTSVRS
jgi:hypothetical protein